MKRLRLIFSLPLLGMATALQAQSTPASQMERLDRAPVALKAQSAGIFVSWRVLGNEDPEEMTFDVLYKGNKIASDLTTTNYVHTTGNASGTYEIVAKRNGTPTDTTEAVTPWTDCYTTLKLNRPAKGAKGGTYSPNDCSVADVDGDGKYELIVKWDPSNSQDNSKNGYTDNVLIDCYRFTGEHLWRIDLGVNIRAGAHYTQFMVYDFDGDGKAELMCKTAPGSKDGKGIYVNQAATDATIKAADNTKDWRNGNGRVNGGQEYLTVFNGETGAAIHTIAYWPNRNAKTELSDAAGTFDWDDRSSTDNGSYGNRGERYLAAVAYLDGPDKTPCGIFSRGYYTYAYIWAVSFEDGKLYTKWLHASDSKTKYSVFDASGKGKTYTAPVSSAKEGRNTMYGNGNHNLSVADVDGDGKDEVLWGSAALDDDGTLLYAVGFGHGDAIHLSDLLPDRPGLELFQVHEDKGTYSWDIHDAATGEIIHKGGNKGIDNGRGLAADIMAENRGFEFWSSDNDTTTAKKYGGLNEKYPRSATTGETLAQKSSTINYRIYWDGDLQDELLDGNKIDKWNGSGFSRVYINGKNPYDYNGSSTCNSTKNTPCLQADILGDWREEIILWSSTDNCTLNIFSTNTPTDFTLPTLMHDHTYRMGIAWQNVAYNQPPHLGFYLPDYFLPSASTINESPAEQDVLQGESIVPIVIKWRNCKGTPLITSYDPDGTRKGFSLPLDGLTYTTDVAARTITITGKPMLLGTYTFTLNLRGKEGTNKEAKFQLTVLPNPTGIAEIGATRQSADTYFYNMQGQRIEKPRRGMYIVNGRKYLSNGK